MKEKLSFSLPSSKSSSSKSNKNPIKPSQTTFNNDEDSSTNQQSNKQLITEFDPSKPQTLNPKTLIPPIENQWRPYKKMKNLDLPITDSHSSHSLSFEKDTSLISDQTADNSSYGLNLRTTAATTEQSDVDVVDAPKPRASVEVSMLQKFKEDMERLPDDQGFDEYIDVPVDGFGAALLGGYGWKEGMGIGKNAKEDIKVVEVKRRTGKEGLGFVADMPPPTSKKSERNGKVESEKRKKEERVVRIVRGRDVGLKASVVGRVGDDVLVLKVLETGGKIEVKIDDVAELGSVEEDRCLRKLKDLKVGRDEEKGSRSKRDRDEEKGSRSKRERDEEKGSRSRRERDEVEERRVNGNGGGKEEKGKKQVSWLTSHIRVRVVSQSLKGGRFYKKKGEVLDVIGPTTCDISMDESREIVQGVSQDMLETAIPRRGGPVLVLSGKHKGAFGSLVERDLDREIGIVRDADTHEMLNVKLEHMAEYIGDPSLLGH